MDATGRAREGWLAIVPMAVLVVFIVVGLGGPMALINVILDWATDLSSMLVAWVHWL